MRWLMTDTELRLILIVLGAVILLAVYLFGRRRAPRDQTRPSSRRVFERQEPNLGGVDERVEPVFADGNADHAAGNPLNDELARAWNPESEAPPVPRAEGPLPGVRREAHFDRIVTLHVMANDGGQFGGHELVVAAEKASLVHGDRGLFHRLVDGKPELGPIFSMVNRVQPGNFDLSHLDQVRTPGVSLFMILPGPLSALDGWERMLPVAQRLSELLKGSVFDEQMNPIGRQRIASIRDELRAYDRKQESREIRPRW
jgi:cell division protein ZipA